MKAGLPLGVLSLLAVASLGQNQNVVSVGGGFQRPPATFPSNPSLPPVGPIPSLGPNTPLIPHGGVFIGHPGINRPVFRPRSLYPFGFPVLGGGYYYDNPSPTNVIIVQAPSSQPPPSVPQAPPEPVKPQLREYKWTAGTELGPGEAEPATFLVALKDGIVYSAEAAWVENGMLHFLTPERIHRSVPIDSVDRSLTEKLNRERKLNFRLP